MNIQKIKSFLSDDTAPMAKVSLWYMISSILTAGISTITTPIFARIMTKGEYGYYSNFTSVEAIVAVIVTLQFATSIQRAKYDYGDDIDGYLSSVLLFGNFVTIIAWVFVEIFSGYFQNLFSMSMVNIRLMFLSVFFTPVFSCLQTKYRIYNQYRFTVLFSVLSSVIITISSLIFVIQMNDKAQGRIIGTVIATVFVYGSLWAYVIKRRPKINFEYIKYGCIISVPLIPHALSNILLSSSDRVMITQFRGAEETALYTIPYQVSTLANIVWGAMNKAWTPWMYDRLHENNYEEIRKKSRLYIGVFSILIVGLYLVAPEIILIMGGNHYMETIYIMPPIILGFVFQFIYSMYVNIEIYCKKTFSISFGTALAAAINIGLNMILISRWGYKAAAYTTLIGFFFQFLFHYVIVWSRHKEYLTIYNSKDIVFVVGIMSVMALLSIKLYDYSIIRYLILLIYVCVLLRILVKNKKYIINLFSRK